MSLLPLHLLGSPVLRQRSAEVGRWTTVRRLVDDMFETMDAAHGVAWRRQVGVARRVAWWMPGTDSR
jgi:peptide deformylase